MEGAVAFLAFLWLGAAVGGLLCFLWTLFEAFRRGHQRIAVVSLLLTPVVGIGMLVAFYYGWREAQRSTKTRVERDHLNMKHLMAAWTGCLVLAAVSEGIALLLGTSATLSFL